MAQKRESGKLVAENRKARFNYAIEDKLEAGLVLTGSEVKSLRAGKANIADAYASDEGGGALYLVNAHIAEYAQSRTQHPRAHAAAQAPAAQARARPADGRDPAARA